LSIEHTFDMLDGPDAAPPHRDPEHEAVRRHGALSSNPFRRRDEHPASLLACVPAAGHIPTVAIRRAAHIVRTA